MNINFKLIPSEKLSAIIPLVKFLNQDLSSEQIMERFQKISQSNYKCLGVWDYDKLVGICGLWEGTKFWCGYFLELDNVVFLPEYRNQGIGQKMMGWIENYAVQKKYDVIVLDAYVTNTSSHRFYERFGFKPLGYHFVKKI